MEAGEWREHDTVCECVKPDDSRPEECWDGWCGHRVWRLSACSAHCVAAPRTPALLLVPDEAWDLRVVDELDAVRAAHVLRDTDLVIVGDAHEEVVQEVLEDAPEAVRVVEIGLRLRGQVDALRIAPTLDVGHAVVRPRAFVVANQLAARVRRASSCACQTGRRRVTCPAS